MPPDGAAQPAIDLTTTPLWVPLIVAGIGVTGTLLAGLAGALIANRHAKAREALAWDRDRQREQERWGREDREDRERTFDARREALEDFHDALRAMTLRAYNHGMGLGDDPGDELPEGWQMETFHRLHRVQLYASPETARLASEAYSAAWRWGHLSRRGRDDEAFYDSQDAYDTALGVFVTALRRDLRVAEGRDESA